MPLDLTAAVALFKKIKDFFTRNGAASAQVLRTRHYVVVFIRLGRDSNLADVACLLSQLSTWRMPLRQDTNS